jgi:hypothetical protein
MDAIQHENKSRILGTANRRRPEMNSLVPDSPTLSPAPHEALPPVPFGPAPLIEGEDAGAYDELLVRISTAVRPADIFEEIWVRDVVDLVWEALRLRRLKACAMTAGARKALAQNLRPLVGWDQANGLARSWSARKPGAHAAVEEHLVSAGIGLEGVVAEGLCIELDKVERIDRMIMAAEARRNAALREIDRHRAALGPRLRQAVLEAEAQEIAFAQEGAAAESAA